MADNVQRRAIYKYYRDQGYTPQQARNMRNRPDKVFTDWIEKKRTLRGAKDLGVKPPKAPKAPFKALTRKKLLSIRAKLVSLGISKRAAYNMTRSKEKAVNNLYNIEQLLKRTGKPTRKTAKKALKKMLANWEKAQSTADVYESLEEWYARIVGVPELPEQKLCPKCGSPRIAMTLHKRYVQFKCLNKDCKHIWKE